MEADLNRAQNYYQRLVQGHPKSSLADDACLAIAYLYLDHFKDPGHAWLRFRDVVSLSPEGDAAPEAKRQLKRLSRYAQPDPPPQTAVDLRDPASPTPPGAALAEKPAPAKDNAAKAPAPAPAKPAENE